MYNYYLVFCEINETTKRKYLVRFEDCFKINKKNKLNNYGYHPDYESTPRFKNIELKVMYLI